MVNSLMDIHVVCTCVLSPLSTISLLSISDRFFPNSVGDQSEDIWLFFFTLNLYYLFLYSLGLAVPDVNRCTSQKVEGQKPPTQTVKKTIHLSHE